MSVARSAKVLLQGAAWRLMRTQAAGRRLIEAVVTGDEDARTLAGMLLVRTGEQSRELVIEALEGGVDSQELVTVLASIGGPEAEHALARLAEQSQRPIADEARRALGELEEIKRRQH